MTLLDPALPSAHDVDAPADDDAHVAPTRATDHDGSAVAGAATTVALGVALIAAWAVSIAAALALETGHTLHMSALFLHLGCLIAGFGAVLTLDWFGLLWLTGRRSLADVIDAAGAAHLLVWLGLLGLTLTGVMLEPELTTMTCVKLGAVLVVALNGLGALRLHHVMALHVNGPPRWVMVWSGVTVMVSQLGWWTACLIGFLNAHS